MADELITLVIHTPARAHKLQVVLKSHNIYSELVDINFNDSSISEKPLKVKVKISDLPLALKILESADFVSTPVSIAKMGDMSHILLIPVDFSPASIIAVKVGFYLAQIFEVDPVILHSFITPNYIPDDFYENQVDPVEIPDFANIQEEITLQNIAESQMSKFKNKVEALQNKGEITKIKFSSLLIEGVAEQVIHEYCREHKPMFVVMATRGIDKKESDLIGSVTAEVIDSCRVPILTVPDNYIPKGVENVKNVVMFCNFTSYDAITLRALMRSFNFPTCNIWLIPSNDSNFNSAIETKLDRLTKYFTEIYPTATFHSFRLGKGKFDDKMREMIDSNNIDFIIVPNKKTNAINRFFHPTIAHKILFERDIPLLVIPV